LSTTLVWKHGSFWDELHSVPRRVLFVHASKRVLLKEKPISPRWVNYPQEKSGPVQPASLSLPHVPDSHHPFFTFWFYSKDEVPGIERGDTCSNLKGVGRCVPSHPNWVGPEQEVGSKHTDPVVWNPSLLQSCQPAGRLLWPVVSCSGGAWCDSIDCTLPQYPLNTNLGQWLRKTLLMELRYCARLLFSLNCLQDIFPYSLQAGVSTQRILASSFIRAFVPLLKP